MAKAKTYKYKFRLMVSDHEDENGKRYVKGDIISTDRDLATAFGSNKFRRVKSGSAPIDETDDDEEFEDEDEIVEDEDEDEVDDADDEDLDDDDADNNEAPAGKDVTADFAKKEGFKVFAHPGNYFTVTRDGLPAHEGKIRKTKVTQLLKAVK